MDTYERDLIPLYQVWSEEQNPDDIYGYIPDPELEKEAAMITAASSFTDEEIEEILREEAIMQEIYETETELLSADERYEYDLAMAKTPTSDEIRHPEWCGRKPYVRVYHPGLQKEATVWLDDLDPIEWD